MRIRIVLAPFCDSSSRPLLQFDYQYEIAALLYNCIRDINPELASKLHDSLHYKPYTFSRLEIPKRRVTKFGIRLLCDDTYLWASSPDRELCLTIAQGLMARGTVKFGGVRFAIVNIQIIDQTRSNVQHIDLTTKSPIIVRSPRDPSGNPRVWDLSPDDDQFGINLVVNLMKRYEQYYGRAPVSRPTITGISNVSQKRIWIKDTSHRAYLMNISLKGPPELLQFAYDSGLGEKTAMGFGMVSFRGE